jgi:arsenite methyltransferase
MVPTWFSELVGIDPPSEGDLTTIRGQRFVLDRGVLRASQSVSDTQAQTSDTFGYKWHKRDTFESSIFLNETRDWLTERYGEVSRAEWWPEHGERPVMLDAGCGAALSALLLFESILPRIHYIGADVSAAVEVAARRFLERGLDGAFLQADLMDLPLPPESVDVIFSEGVLHHTDSPEAAFTALVPLLKPGGRILFYVYRRKGPIREFTDDYIRELLNGMEPDAAWEALMPLTKLGQALGELDVEVDVPEPIELLGIPAGRINLQRLFYWHVFKAYYKPEFTLDELNHINFDWYTPANAHRQSEEEVRDWCTQAGLEVEREYVHEAGITVFARKPG